MFTRRHVLGLTGTAAVAAIAGQTFRIGPAFASVPTLADGSGKFELHFGSKRHGWDIDVYTYKPKDLGADAPVVFVVHGLARDAAYYRDSWIGHAEAGRFIVIAPEFNKVNFPRSAQFNQGNVLTGGGLEVPAAEWSFVAVETAFDLIVRANGLATTRYDIYGHSAGSQFVHRMNWFLPKARIRTAVAANAGWYTFPDETLAYPAGIKDARLTRDCITAGLARDMVVLLGTADNDPNHKHLPKTPEANAQGPHRLARGQNFFAAGKRLAENWKVPFGWRLQFVEGVAHSNPKMSIGAAPFVGQAIGGRR